MRRSSTSRRLRHRSPHSLLLPLPPPYLPGSILPSPQEERKRLGLLHLLLRGKGGGGACGAPLLRAAVAAAPSGPLIPLLFPLLLPLLPLLPSVQMCVVVALPDRLIVVSLCSARPLALLPCCFRCSAVSLAEVPPDPWSPPPRG